MITSIEYEDFKAGNYNSLHNYLNDTYTIKCNRLEINDTNREKSLDDGTFFGICVIPKITHSVVKKVYNCVVPSDVNNEGDEVKVVGYDIEIDSRVFDLLDSYQFNTYLTYEIEKFTNINHILRRYYDFVTLWCSQNGVDMIRSDKSEIILLYYYMCREYLSHSISLQNIASNSNILEIKDVMTTDDIATLTEIGKLFGTVNINNVSPTTLTVIILRTLDNIDAYKNDIIKYIEQRRKLNVIKIYDSTYATIIDCLKKLNNKNLEPITEGFRDSKLYMDFKKSGAKRLEEKYYEISINAKTIKDKADAMDVLREINSSIRILESLISMPNLDEYSREKYDDLKINFMTLRDTLLDNKVLKEPVRVITLNDLLKGNFAI